MSPDLHEKVQDEITSLHAFFCLWFGGRVERGKFEELFSARFSDSLVFIPPAGNYLGFSELVKFIHAGYATNSDFKIQIRNVQVLYEMDDFILATYEEWQRNALASAPADNGRLATVLFHNGARLKWHHIHETWLPREVMEADAYDF